MPAITIHQLLRPARLIQSCVSLQAQRSFLPFSCLFHTGRTNATLAYSHPEPTEIVTVPERKSLSLHIYYPPKVSEKSPVVLHLPFYTKHGPSISSILRWTSSTVVVPHYPPGTHTPAFPLVLHDIIAALHRVLFLFPQAQVGIHGTGFSGALAISTGLTEPVVAAVAAERPVVDLFTCGPFEWDTLTGSWVDRGVTPLREKIFGSDPSNWMDPFASPLFFFKTPGLDLLWVADDDKPAYESMSRKVERKERAFKRYNGELCHIMIALREGEDYGEKEFIKAARRAYAERYYFLMNHPEPHQGEEAEYFQDMRRLSAKHMAKGMVHDWDLDGNLDESLDEGDERRGILQWLGRTLTEAAEEAEKKTNAKLPLIMATPEYTTIIQG